MARAPANQVLDIRPAVTLADPRPARVGLLALADAQQHALMSQWGGPDHWVSCYLDETETKSLKVRWPPGAVYADIRALMSGTCHATWTTTTDATGTKLQPAWGAGPPDTVEHALWSGTTGIGAGGAGAASGRAVQMVASVSWAWQDVTLTVTMGGLGGHLLGFLVRPVWVSQ